MMVSHQEASGIPAKYASSKPWMTKLSHLHVQEEVQFMQMMGDFRVRKSWRLAEQDKAWRVPFTLGSLVGILFSESRNI